MEILSKEEFLKRKKEMLVEIMAGKIFVYPTDTIYGIGCNALIGESVRRIREIKQRDEKPFSVIAPSKDWIRKKCFVDEKVEKWLGKLPGAYTLILELRENGAVSEEVCVGWEGLGVRLPDNWFASVIGEVGLPFVTTSVNLSGEKPCSEIGEIDKEILDKIDYVIDVGRLGGKPSRVVNLLAGREEVKER